jgi:hypothetical protein
MRLTSITRSGIRFATGPLRRFGFATAALLILAGASFAGGDPCALPGVTVVTDPSGDQNSPGTSAQDIQSISIAELGADTDTLTFTLKVGDLSSPPMNGNWYVIFTATNKTSYFVDMETDVTGAATFNYGTSDPTTGFTSKGAADKGSFTPDGTITIKIGNAKVGGVKAGDQLAAVNGQTSLLVGTGAVGGLLVTIDTTENGAYPLVGNASCAAGGTPTPPPTASATPSASPSATPPTGGGSAGDPRFFSYVSPPGSGDDSGEPSLGINYKTEKSFANSMFTTPNGGTSLYFGGFSPYMLKITFDDCSSPANATWEQKATLLSSTPRAFGDPILFTDHETGRTFVSQLEGLTPAGSTTDITDDDGDTFMPSEGSDLPSDVDHQTFGGGPFAPPLDGAPNPVYPHAVYYASQSVAEARAALSVDGGVTFNEGVPMYTDADCSGLHGHIKVAPDGTAYVPNNGCGGTDLVNHSDGQQAVIVSGDDGTTWSIRKIPGTTTKGDDDPSVGVASDSNTIYEGMQSGDGHPRVAVSHDKGLTWSAPFDVGAAVVNGGPVLNTAFPAVVAGDPDRAAFAFFGSETGGDNYHCGEGEDCSPQPPFAGIWYLYVASTFDGGKTWTTQNVTPGDPVQRGGICNSGTCRNQLDFFDIQMDKEGRVLVGWDDGCIGACVQGPPNSYSSKATITRQSGGKRLLAAFDPVEPAIPGAPLASGTIDAAMTHVDLTWQVPDNGGSPLTAYHVYRRAGETGDYTLIATVPETNYTDTTFDSAAKNFYHVAAVNAIGEGPFCKDFEPLTGVVTTSACVLPGVKVVNDLNPDGSDNDGGQNTPPDPSVNIREIFIAEPDLGAGVNKMIFTMQVGQNGTVAPNSGWYIVWNRLHPDADFDRFYVAMKTDSTGAITYEYGKFGVALDTSGNVPNPNSNTPSKVGDADKGTFDPATGLITITVTTNNLDGLKPGDPMNGVNGRTFYGTEGGPPHAHNQAAANDITIDGTYVVAGNAACITNQPPTASLSASPTTGPAPLTVNFDASASIDPDAGDSIASYTFSFGDGTDDATQNVPTISHTYNHGGSFFATCTVKDSHGQISANIASVVIKTGAQLVNISTRLRVQTGDNVLIGGFIIAGADDKKIIVRGLGPSVQANGQPVPGTLQDPVLELHDGTGAVIATNDNWKDTQQAEIEATGIPPSDDRESAIVQTLSPGNYTVILRGKDDTTGVGVVEAYDIGFAANSRLANLSTRGFVDTGDNVMIGGFMAGPTDAAGTRVVVRAIGPSLTQSAGLAQTLQDPNLEVHDTNGATIASNDNWRDSQEADITATGLQPTDDRESAIVMSNFEPGAYTAIVRGKDNSTGIGLVELYDLRQ